jgi:hypothetical protein
LNTTYVEVSCLVTEGSGSSSAHKEYQAGEQGGLNVELHIVELFIEIWFVCKLEIYIESSEYGRVGTLWKNIYSPKPTIHMLAISPGSTHMSLQTHRWQIGYKGAYVSTIYIAHSLG